MHRSSLVEYLLEGCQNVGGLMIRIYGSRLEGFIINQFYHVGVLTKKFVHLDHPGDVQQHARASYPQPPSHL